MNAYRSTPLIAAAFALSMIGCSAQKAIAPPPPTVAVAESRGPGTGLVEETAIVTATVQAIDQSTRMVTLLGPDGKTVTVRAGDNVKNLAQVKKGDQVTMAFYESVAYDVKKKGTTKPGMTEATDVAKAPLGQMPAAGGARVVTITATILAIDKKTNTVKLKGPEGKVVSVKVKDPSRLEGVNVGDLVEITHTEAVAISVEKPGA